MKLSREVLELEQQETKLVYEDNYNKVTEEDECLAKFLEFQQEQLILITEGEDKVCVMINDEPYISVMDATEVLNKAMLELYYLMGVQAEINDMEK